MISRDDLKAAVAAGVVSERQAAQLIGLSDSRRGMRENLSAHDEPFELFKGFNEIFIVVGLVILASGWTVITTYFDGFGASVSFLLGAILIWLLTEYFVSRRRMVAPAIALSVLFMLSVGVGLGILKDEFLLNSNTYSILPPVFAVTTLALTGFWFRFRVPFALALIALGLFLVALIGTATFNASSQRTIDAFLLSSNGALAWITLALGLGVFALAMMFDMSDPHRVTRRSANGFWLHLVAAPALVNTIGLTLLSNDTPASNAILLGFLGLMAIVAIVIDRRSFLMAGVGYIFVLTQAIAEADGAMSNVTQGVTVLILGVALLILGAFWDRIRSIILAPLSNVISVDRLPPFTNRGSND